MIDVPTLPTAAARSPAGRRIASSIRTVVVLPFVPVTASHGAAEAPRSRQASPASPINSPPAACAAIGSGWVGGTPGVTHTRSAPGGSDSTSPRKCAPAASSEVTPSGVRRSASSTRAPRSSSARAALSPASATPYTTTVRPASSSAMADELGVEQAHPECDSDTGDDPEPDDDRDFLPPRHLEVVVQRRHPERTASGAGSPAGVLEPAGLDEAGQGHHREQPAQYHQQQFDARQDRHCSHQPAERHGTGVAHEDLCRRGVPPEKSEAGAHGGGAQDRKITRVADLVAAVRADTPRAAQVPSLDKPDYGECTEHHRSGAGRQPVQSVGEVH